MSRPPRLHGFDDIGRYRYFLTFSARDRRRSFLDSLAARETLNAIVRTAREERFADLAYCVMPAHLHWLVEGRSCDSDLRRLATMAKRRSGAIYAMRTGVALWQEGYYDRVIRDEVELYVTARYVIENPVRAGLVSAPVDWPYSGSEVWTFEQILAL